MECQSTVISSSDLAGNSGHTPLNNNSQDSNEVVTFKQVLFHLWRNGSDSHHNTTSSSTLLQIWFSQNVHHLVTPKRVFCFTLSHICFILAYGFFSHNQLYKTFIHGGEDRDYAPAIIFVTVAFGVHTLCLIFLFFFNFRGVALENNRFHYIGKSVVEFVVKILVVLFLIRIGDNQQMESHHAATSALASSAATSVISFNDSNIVSSEVAGLVTWCLLSIDALCIMGLLNPGHHYSLFEAIVTLTLHLGMTREKYCSIPTAVFVLVIVLIKNFLWKHFDHPKLPSNNEIRPAAWVASQVV